MSRLLQSWRIVRTGSRNFFRNLWLSVAATAVMTLTLTIVVVSFISNQALTSTIKGVTDKIDVSVYLKTDVTTDQIKAFEASLLASGNVQSVRYLTQAEVVATYKLQHKNDPSLIQALDLTGDDLPPSVEIKAKNPNRLDAIAATVELPANKVLQDPTAPPSYTGSRKNTIDRIVNFSDFFKSTGLYASIIFVVISVLIIFNTIRMAIFTRRDEIEIMKLVGATPWFVRGPFLFEAALYGIIAAVIAVSLSYVILLVGGPKLQNYIDVASTIHLFRSYPVLVAGAELVIGIAIGTFSSLLAMGRYLKL